MKRGSMKEAKKIFYDVLKGNISKKEGLEKIYQIANKKILKGYYFGVRGIIFKQDDNPYTLKVETLKLRDAKYLVKKMEEYAAFKFTSEFDKGYLYAWIDYLKFFIENKK